MKKIREVLRKNETILYIVEMIKKMSDSDFRAKVLMGDKDPLTLKLEHNGELHKGKIIYLIENDWDSGFYAVFNNILWKLAYADIMGFVPVVLISNKFPYYVENGVDGKMNPWDYYFETTSEICPKDVEASFLVTKGHEDERDFFYLFGENSDNAYKYSESTINVLGEIQRKYVRLNKRTETYLNQHIENLLKGKRTLGIHVRRGALEIQYAYHPQIPTLEEYISYIDDMLEKKYFEQIFLATDDERVLKEMRAKYKDKLVYYCDVSRVSGPYLAAFVDSKDPLYNYKCGLEVIRDVYTLAECDALIGGLSQVTYAARILKRAKKESFEEQVIIDKGIHNSAVKGKNNRELVEEEKLAAKRAEEDRK